MIFWHYDHCKGRSVKGINLLNALYCSQEVSIPVAFEVVKKPTRFCDVETRKEKRASEVTKNEQMRKMIQTCINNQLKFIYILMDSWFSAKENFEFSVQKGKYFIAALKENRLVALSEEDKKTGAFCTHKLVRIIRSTSGARLTKRLQSGSAISTPNLYKQRWQHGFVESGA